MKLSEKQAMMLLDIAKDSLHIIGTFGGYPPAIRAQLVNDIINQQSDELKELDKPTKPTKPTFPPNQSFTEGAVRMETKPVAE